MKTKHTIEVEVQWNTGIGTYSHSVYLNDIHLAYMSDKLASQYGIERPYEPKVGDIVEIIGDAAAHSNVFRVTSVNTYPEGTDLVVLNPTVTLNHDFVVYFDQVRKVA